MSDLPGVVPAYLVRGDDVALVSEAVSKLVAELCGGDRLGVEEVADDAEVSAVLDACQTPAFLTERRVVLAREAGRFNAEDGKRLAAYLDDPNPTTALVLVGGGGTVPKALVDAVKKVGRTIDAGVPGGKGRAQWVADRIADSQVRLEPAAARMVDAHLGEDLSRLGALLETLAAAYGDGATIGVDEVTPFLGEAGGVAPWDLTDAIDRGDVATSLVVLHRQMEGGERHPLVVMSTLHRHYEAMLRLDGSGAADERAAAELLGISPFPARKALHQARRLGSHGVQRAISLLAQADLELRGANEWPDELVMEVLVARLARLTRR